VVKDRLRREKIVAVDKRDEPVMRGMIEFAASGEDVPIALDDIRALDWNLAIRLTIPTEAPKL
jgi:hypothetical protein